MNNIDQLRDLLQREGNFVIAVGPNYRLDEMAAALSLFLALGTMGKNPTIVSPKAPLVEVSNLVGIDKVKTKYESSTGDLVVSFPYKEGEIEKVSYTLDGGLLNIVVKPGPAGLSFNQNDISFKRGGSAPAVLLTIGVQRLSDLNRFFNTEELKDTAVINIDRNPQNQGFGDLVVVSDQASSVSEQVGNILLSLGINPDVDMAQNLLTGILDATNNFQNPRTSPTAFEVSATLIRNGAKRVPPRDSAKQKVPQEFMPGKVFKGPNLNVG